MEEYGKIVAVGMVIRKTYLQVHVQYYRNISICATTTTMQLVLVCAIACMHSYSCKLTFSSLISPRIAAVTALRKSWGRPTR